MKRSKENQDSFVVIDSYGEQRDRMFFGVFDGHGPNGALASQVRESRWLGVALRRRCTLTVVVFIAIPLAGVPVCVDTVC